jgi:hypothetical protein
MPKIYKVVSNFKTQNEGRLYVRPPLGPLPRPSLWSLHDFFSKILVFLHEKIVKTTPEELEKGQKKGRAGGLIAVCISRMDNTSSTFKYQL